MTASKTPDLDSILPEEAELSVDGIQYTVKRLKSREFLKLIRVVTNGMGTGMGSIDLSGGEEEMQGKLLALLVMAVPEAEDEFTEFVQAVSVAKDPKRAGDLSKALENPELDVTVDILTAVAAQEVGDFAALVGKLKAALKIVQSAYRPTGK